MTFNISACFVNNLNTHTGEEFLYCSFFPSALYHTSNCMVLLLPTPVDTQASVFINTMFCPLIKLSKLKRKKVKGKFYLLENLSDDAARIHAKLK